MSSSNGWSWTNRCCVRRLASSTQPAEDDISRYAQDMLTKVLGADRYPFVQISVTQPGITAGSARLDVALTVHGVTRVHVISVQVGMSESEISVAGRFAVLQSDFASSRWQYWAAR